MLARGGWDRSLDPGQGGDVASPLGPAVLGPPPPAPAAPAPAARRWGRRAVTSRRAWSGARRGV